MAKKNNKTTFVLSDESVNSYGFVVLTSGIDTARFERNPVMLYMHNRDGNVIGRWENIRKDGQRLLADAVFDEHTELGAKIKQQVESGFLRSVSIGIDSTVIEKHNGTDTVIKCRLMEASIVDIPSNENAVKLFCRSGGYVYKLNDIDEDTSDSLREALKDVLGLESEASDADILEAVKNAVNGEKTPEQEVDDAILHGYIDREHRTNFCLMAKGNKNAFVAYIDAQRKTQETEIDKLLQDAAKTGKILHIEKDIYRRVGMDMGITMLRELLFTLHTPVKFADLIKQSIKRDNWKLNDYRKYAPDELENDPELYSRLLKEETGKNIEPHTLEWYRRNNPEYLRENPDVFRELIQKEKENKLKNQ